MNNQQLVKEFQLIAEQPVSDTPTRLTTAQYEFRKSIYLEEFNELKAAIETNNKVEQLDALADMQYVNLGTANQIGKNIADVLNYARTNFTINVTQNLEANLIVASEKIFNEHKYAINTALAASVIYRLGFDLGFTVEQLDKAFVLVHQSNMTKFATSYADADKTIKQYADKGIETYCVQNGPHYAILRNSDNKVMKAWNYSPVDLTKV